MTSVYKQLVDLCEATEAAGRRIELVRIRTDVFGYLQIEAREAGTLSGDERTILGHPFEVADHVASDDGIFSVLDAPADGPGHR